MIHSSGRIMIGPRQAAAARSFPERPLASSVAFKFFAAPRERIGVRCVAACERVVTVTAWEAWGGRDLRAPPATSRLGPAYAWEPGGDVTPRPRPRHAV